MPLAVPGKVIKLQKNSAIVEMFGSRTQAKNKFLQLKLGDYVLVQDGIIVDKLSDFEVKKILREWEAYTLECEKAN